MSEEKKKITAMQQFALKCYYEAIKNEFFVDFSAKIRTDIENAKFEDDYKALEGYMKAKTSERVSMQIERFFKKLLESIIE